MASEACDQPGKMVGVQKSSVKNTTFTKTTMARGNHLHVNALTYLEFHSHQEREI